MSGNLSSNTSSNGIKCWLVGQNVNLHLYTVVTLGISKKLSIFHKHCISAVDSKSHTSKVLKNVNAVNAIKPYHK